MLHIELLLLFQKHQAVTIRGEHCALTIDRLFGSVSIKEQGYNPSLAVLRLSNTYTDARLESACELAISRGIKVPRYRHLKAILAANQDIVYKEACRQQYKTRYVRLPGLLDEFRDKSLVTGGKGKVLNKYAAFKVLVLDEWLISDLSKADIEFLFELTERRFDSTSTIFCTLYKREDWVKRLGGTTYAESIMERFAYNTTWVETGDINMRQHYNHA